MARTVAPEKIAHTIHKTFTEERRLHKTHTTVAVGVLVFGIGVHGAIKGREGLVGAVASVFAQEHGKHRHLTREKKTTRHEQLRIGHS